jgi:L-threonylcarbamoyladenylate synthase
MGRKRLNTEILKIDPENIDKSLIMRASGIILSGGLVAFPTETVYGLGANAADAAAVKGIFRAKGRPSDNPLIVHVSSIDQVERIVSGIPGMAKKLMEAFWPGPLTLVMGKAESVPSEITAGLDTVGVRMPSHPVALALIETSGVLIAAPSANRSGKPSPTSASHVIDDLFGRIHAIIDSGKCNVGLESTVLDIHGDMPVILRPGAVTKEQIASITGAVEISGDAEENIPRSPGMKYSHYTPNAKVIVVSGAPDNVADKIVQMASTYEKSGMRVGILATVQTVSRYGIGTVINIGDRTTPETIAFNLFNALRECDGLKIDIVLAESVEMRGLGHAIMNRMYKAAGYNIIRV